MDLPWLSAYPAGVPHEIDLESYPHLGAFLEERCKKTPDKIAFEQFNVEMSFAELDRLSLRLAGFLQSVCGLKAGDRFAIMLPNTLQFPVALFAALRIGLTVVNLNPLYTAYELRPLLKDAGIRVVLVLENVAHVVAEAVEGTPVERVMVTRFGDCMGWLKGQALHVLLKYIRRSIPSWSCTLPVIALKDVLYGRSVHPVSPVTIGPEDLAFIQYTGGTTGVPKGAMLTHRNVLANVLQCLSWIKPVLRESEEVVVLSLPLYHIFGLTGCCFFMGLGACGRLVTNPRDFKGFIGLLKARPFTVFLGLNTLFLALMRQPGFDAIDFSGLRLVVSGGMPLDADVFSEWKRRTGSVILEGYGLTEASPVVTINPTQLTTFGGTVGLPLPSTVVQIREDHGALCPTGSPGLLWVKGPQVMRGYWGRSAATDEVIDEHGWLCTGDIAQLDAQGFVKIVGREKDLIIVSGFNVYPHEVEEVILQHPGVLEVAVVGVPDARSGEVIRACVVKADPSLTVADVRAFCRVHLTGYKLPRQVVFYDSLPKSNVGKPLHRVLRDQAKQVGQ